MSIITVFYTMHGLAQIFSDLLSLLSAYPLRILFVIIYVPTDSRVRRDTATWRRSTSETEPVEGGGQGCPPVRKQLLLFNRHLTEQIGTAEELSRA